MHLLGFPTRLGEGVMLNQRREIDAITASGQSILIELAVKQSVGPNGALFFGYMRDISMRKAEEKALVETKERAEVANRAKASFLAMMSHEIRTPMHAVIGVQELLLKRVDLNPEQKDLVESANTSSQSLMGIMNNVLDISKIEAGKYTLEPQPTDLKKLLHEINQTFSIFNVDFN